MPRICLGARAVELWATLKFFGKEGVEELIDRLCYHAEGFATQLQSQGFRILNDVVFNQVLVACDTPELTKATLEHIQKSGECWCGGATWHGEPVIRISVCSWATTEAAVERSVAAFVKARDMAASQQQAMMESHQRRNGRGWVMITSEQKAKAQTFLSLHTNGELLILPNVWNPIGARVLEYQGYPAVATASAAVAESLGYEDGENIKLETMLEILFRISRSVNVPVTADIEAGYADTIETLKENTLRVMETGVVGINLEDSIVEAVILGYSALFPSKIACCFVVLAGLEPATSPM